MESKKFRFKICFLGDEGVGKTSLINRFIEKKFEIDYRPTIGANLLKKDVEFAYKDKKFTCNLILWDIAGQDRYELIRSLYLKGCVGAFLVYDCTRSKTFENITNAWLKDLLINAEKNVSFILIGNKVDLEHAKLVSNEQGKELAEKIDAAEFLETSAKTGENVEDAFKTLVLQILKKLE